MASAVPDSGYVSLSTVRFHTYNLHAFIHYTLRFIAYLINIHVYFQFITHRMAILLISCLMSSGSPTRKITIAQSEQTKVLLSMRAGPSFGRDHAMASTEALQLTTDTRAMLPRPCVH